MARRDLPVVWYHADSRASINSTIHQVVGCVTENCAVKLVPHKSLNTQFQHDDHASPPFK